MSCVWINGRLVDTKVWEPYSFDITSFVRPGDNTLKVGITNTMANAAAVGERFPLLENIDLDGLVGPVRVVPYLRVKLDCRQVE